MYPTSYLWYSIQRIYVSGTKLGEIMIRVRCSFLYLVYTPSIPDQEMKLRSRYILKFCEQKIAMNFNFKISRPLPGGGGGLL